MKVLPNVFLLLALALFTWSGGVAFKEIRIEGLTSQLGVAIVVFACLAIFFGQLIYKKMHR